MTVLLGQQCRSRHSALKLKKKNFDLIKTAIIQEIDSMFGIQQNNNYRV